MRDTHANVIQTGFYTKQSSLKIDDFRKFPKIFKKSPPGGGITQDASQMSSKSEIFKS